MLLSPGMSRLFDSYEFMDRGWDIRVLESFSLRKLWWNTLSEDDQVAVDKKVRLLQKFGPVLPRPHAGVNQSAISKMVRRTDMYISTLQSIIEAMGGKLKIQAVFPSGKVEITQFRKLRKAG